MVKVRGVEGPLCINNTGALGDVFTKRARKDTS